ncbi:Crp/Fnr family transcriptional regulator [Pseudomonas sp. N040]|uniref:Crp/Fnr family transcriptional regulator n=1 Tax=Pseudomonas sp. N040 TaxID=2785325 RepID=UPI0018A327E1|nr:Crp/Fnr family transcriptional regulator [Pseudomonas sp. N040]MBF7729662.1 Crp/Fnr family transcriptional regulator [Pseudomonas sp. N040]MBW7013304.1 Crp/Fnr family transcriptional regulator [Pseudomonas sp. N040]
MSQPVARFLASLPAPSQTALMALAEPWQAAAGDCLFRHQGPVAALWMIDQGQIRFQLDTPGGRTIVTGLASAGHCFGDIEISEGLAALADALAISACRGWRLPRAAVLQAMEQVPGFARLLVTGLARSLRLRHLLHLHTLLQPADQRLALALLNLAQPAVDGSARLVVPVTQDALTEYTGTSRQFVSKHISLWAERGWIATRYRSVEILAPERLRELLDASTDPILLAMMANR